MQILVQHQGQQMGPFSIEELRAALTDGRISPQDIAWWEGAVSWVPVATVPGLNRGAAAGDGSKLAIWSLILGVISLGCGFLSGIPGVICGHVALGRKTRAGVEQGKALAIVGLVTGYLGIVFGSFLFLGVAAGIVVPIFTSAQRTAVLNRSAQNARMIVQALNAYADRHGGKYPAALDDLVGRELPYSTALTDPLAPEFGNQGCIYLRPPTGDSSNRVVIVSRGKGPGGRRAVGFRDSSVQMIPYAPPGGP